MEFFSPQNILETFGILGAAAAIFAETGLFFGFFLPGDSLLIAAGIFTAHGYANIIPLSLALWLAAVLGDNVGYASGRKAGAFWFHKKESFFFQKGYLEKSVRFFNRYGAAAIIIARYVPIVRTFTPILAGISRMKYKKFLFYNILGGFVWVVSLVALGYFLGEILPEHIAVRITLILFIIASTISPFVFYYFRRLGRKNPEAKDRTSTQTAGDNNV